jgi:hypothetical protein
MPKTQKNLIGKLKKGELGQYGYSMKATSLSRHRAINKATLKYGALSIYRKLNAIAVLTKNTSPRTAKVALSDRNYIGKKHGYKSS